MDILFKDDKDEELYNSEKLLKKKYGQLARPITKRLDQLKAFSSLKEYMDLGLGKPHFLDGNYKHCIGITLTGNWRLIVDPLYTEDTDYANLDLSNLRVVTIMEVKDYHGK